MSKAIQIAIDLAHDSQAASRFACFLEMDQRHSNETIDGPFFTLEKADVSRQSVGVRRANCLALLYSRSVKTSGARSGRKAITDDALMIKAKIERTQRERESVRSIAYSVCVCVASILLEIANGSAVVTTS